MQNITENNIPEHEVTIPARVQYPSVRYNPLYYIKDTDVIEIAVFLNGNEQKRWHYEPSIPCPSGYGRLFVADLAVTQSVIPTE